MSKDKIKIVVFGLDGAGKRTLLQYLKKRHERARKTGRGIPDTIPTIGMNPETIQIGDVTFSVWDLGGQLQFRRALWEMYAKNSAGLIYVIDVSDPTRFPEARNNLWRMLRMNHLKDIPLAIFANKVDIFENGQAITEEDLANFMVINLKMNRPIKIFHTSALTGAGIQEGIKWLITEIQKRSQYTTKEMYTIKSLFESEARIPSVDDDPLPEALVGIIPGKTNESSEKSDEDNELLSFHLDEALKILRDEEESASSLTGPMPDKSGEIPQKRFCPYNIRKLDSRTRCVLKLGKDVSCYTQESRPLLFKEGKYFCPELKFQLSKETYKEILEFMYAIQKDSFEKPPTPFIYYFPYPKGPPAASAQGIRKIATVCSHCGEPNPHRKRICPHCGALLIQLE